MGKIFVISDTWFNRPINIDITVEDYNKNIIESWNKMINKSDTVYVLGGFGISDLYHIVLQLNGNIHFLNNYYNHDESLSFDNLKESIYKSINKKLSSKIIFEQSQILVLEENDAILSYLPLSYWYGKETGTLCFHGSEEKSKLDELKINCSATLNNFTAINILDVKKNIDYLKKVI